MPEQRERRWLVRTYSEYAPYRTYGPEKPKLDRYKQWPEPSKAWFRCYEVDMIEPLLPKALHLKPGEGPVELPR